MSTVPLRAVDSQQSAVRLKFVNDRHDENPRDHLVVLPVDLQTAIVHLDDDRRSESRLSVDDRQRGGLSVTDLVLLDGSIIPLSEMPIVATEIARVVTTNPKKNLYLRLIKKPLLYLAYRYYIDFINH